MTRTAVALGCPVGWHRIAVSRADRLVSIGLARLERRVGAECRRKISRSGLLPAVLGWRLTVSRPAKIGRAVEERRRLLLMMLTRRRIVTRMTGNRHIGWLWCHRRLRIGLRWHLRMVLA